MSFEVDTGSGITLISKQTYRNFLSDRNLLKTDIIIKTYSKERLTVLGELPVSVQYRENLYSHLKLYVVSGNGANLLGRSWLRHILLDWV